MQWRWLGAVLLAAIAIHVGSTTRLYMWWGGNSAPARFLVPILPCLAAPIAVAASRWRSPAARAFLWTTATVSLVIAIGGLLDPERLLLFSDPRGKGRIVELLQGPAPLAALLPTFAQEDWRGPLIGLLPWLVAAGITLAAVLQIQRRRGPWLSPLAAGTYGALIFLAAASVLAMRVPAGERQEAARRGAVDVLWRYDPQRLRALDYATPDPRRSGRRLRTQPHRGRSRQWCHGLDSAYNGGSAQPPGRQLSGAHLVCGRVSCRTAK